MKDSTNDSGTEVSPRSPSSTMKQQRRRPLWHKVLGIQPVRPPPAHMDAAEEIPEARAHFLSKLVFWWLNEHMVLVRRRSIHESHELLTTHCIFRLIRLMITNTGIQTNSRS